MVVANNMLQRVLNNLVSNALNCTHAGGVLVAARSRDAEVLIEVWDTGVGIPPEQLDAVFLEFVQLGNPERDRSKGLGLGLTIVRRTVALLGHSLGVHSRVGQGTLFRLRLPHVSVPTLSTQLAQSDLADVTGLFVMVVDDEQDIRYAMQGLLTDWNCLVVTARDGAETFKVLEDRLRPPEALVLDYRLPDGTGVELALRLHNAIGLKIPTLIVTGDVAAEPLHMIERSGFSVLHKPVNPQALRAWLGKVKTSLS